MKKYRYQPWGIMAIAGMSLVLMTGCSGNTKERNAFRQTGIEALNAGNYDNAIDAFEQAINASKGRVGAFELDVLKYRGEAEFRLGDYEASAHTYDVLLKVDKERPEYMNCRAMALAGAGDWNGALELYKKSYELDPKHPTLKEALPVVGQAMEDAGMTEEAMALYQQAVSQQSAGGAIYNRMGVCRLKEEKYEEALAFFQQGIALGELGTMSDLKFNEAVTYEYMGNFETALQLLESYVTAYGRDTQVEREIAFLKTR